MPLYGVNLAGAEFGATGTIGTYGMDYTYPTADELAYYASKGVDSIRLPFTWERIQPTLDGPLDPADGGRPASSDRRSRDRSALLDRGDPGRAVRRRA